MADNGVPFRGVLDEIVSAGMKNLDNITKGILNAAGNVANAAAVGVTSMLGLDNSPVSLGASKAVSDVGSAAVLSVSSKGVSSPSIGQEQVVERPTPIPETALAQAAAVGASFNFAMQNFDRENVGTGAQNGVTFDGGLSQGNGIMQG